MLNKTLFLTHYMKAQQLYNNKFFKEAEESFLKALEYDISDAKCYFKLGMCFFKQELWEEASVYISKAIDLAPDNKDWKNQLTQVQRHIVKCIKSSTTKEDKTRKLLKYENARLYSEIAQVLNKQGKWLQEVDALQKAVDIESTNVSLFYRLGIAQEKINRFSEAAAAIESAINLKKKDIDSQWYYRLGYNLEKSNHSKERITKAYDNAIKNDKKLYSQQYGIGVFHQQRGLWTEASAEYNLTQIEKPLDDKLIYKLAMSYDRQYKWKEAEELYSDVISLNPENLHAYYKLGFVRERQNDYIGASEAYAFAVENRKDHTPFWYYRLGYVLNKTQDYKKSCEAFLMMKKIIVKDEIGIIQHEPLSFTDELTTNVTDITDIRDIKEPQNEINLLMEMLLDENTNKKELFIYTRNLTNEEDNEDLIKLFFDESTYKEKVYDYIIKKRKEQIRTQEKAEAKEQQIIQKEQQIIQKEQQIIQKDQEIIQKEQTKALITVRILEKTAKNNITCEDLWFKLAQAYQVINEYEKAESVCKKLLERKQEHNSGVYFSLAHILTLQKEYEKASHIFILSKIIQEAEGMNKTKYNDNKNLKTVVDYTMFYEQYDRIDNVILFESFSAETCSDNPYALFKEILSNVFFENWKFVWVLNDDNLLPSEYRSRKDVIIAKKHSHLYMKYLTTSKVLIANAVFPTYFIKKDQQIYINTWHGTPWKTLGNDNPMQNGNTARNFIQADYLISPNHHTSNVYLNSYDIKGFFRGQLLESGYPRIDSMINSTQKNQSRIKSILNIKNDKPIVLYAPTYKGLWSTPDIEADEIKEYISNLKDDEYNIIFRGHYFVESAINSSDIDVTVASHTIDTCELLSVVDILITDYSSIFFDFLPLKKPIFLFVYDYEEYKKERGLYFGLDEVPGFVTKDIKILKDNIINALRNPSSYTNDNESFIETFSPYEDGNSSKRVIEELINNIEGKRTIPDEKEKESILIYPGEIKTIDDLLPLESFISSLDYNTLDICILFNKTELVSNQEIKNKVDTMEGIISCLEYSGAPDKTLEESWIFSKVKNNTIKLNDEQTDILKTFYEREYKRLFSKKKFNYGIILNQDKLLINLIFSSKNIKKSYILQDKGSGYIQNIEGSSVECIFDHCSILESYTI